jgi:hypothetical protein
MRLFHCSNEQYTTLTPQVGARRHDGEGVAAVDKAVIWLSNDSESVASQGGQVIRFRHEVWVPDSDPDLVVDENLAQLMQMSERMYSKPMPIRWYTYSKPLEVISVAEYDDEAKQYVPI